MCNHASEDKLAPGICLVCHLTGDAFFYAFLAFCASYILGQMVRAQAFFTTLAGRLWG